MKIKTNFFLLLFSVVVVFSSCKVMKKSFFAKKNLSKQQILALTDKPVPKSFKLKYSVSVQNFSIPGGAYFQLVSDTNGNYYGNVLTAFMSLFKFWVLQDSIYQYLPLSNAYFALPKDTLLSYNGFVYPLKAFLGIAFSLVPDVNLKDFDVAYENKQYVLSYKLKDKSNPKLSVFYQKIFLTPDFYVDSLVFYDFVNFYEIYAKYSGYKNVKSGDTVYYLPKNISLKLIRKDTVNLLLTLRQAAFDKNFAVRKKIPEDAKRLDYKNYTIDFGF